jgi:shikimate dehydrogenase
MTDRYAVFGNPVGHSKSPRIHMLFAAQTGQDISYQAILADKDAFPAAIDAFVAANGGPARGANVTVPFKEEAFRLATARTTARADAAGAVNTLSFEAGRITRRQHRRRGPGARPQAQPGLRPGRDAASCCWVPAARRAA